MHDSLSVTEFQEKRKIINERRKISGAVLVVHLQAMERGPPSGTMVNGEHTFCQRIRSERSRGGNCDDDRALLANFGCNARLVGNSHARLSASGWILRINLDGTNPVPLVSNIAGSLVELDLDLPDGKMYWMTSVGIFDANLNGSGVKELLAVGPLATLAKDDMIVTSTNIFWTESGSIFRARLDGSGKQEIFQASAAAGAATGLAYDSATATLYWYGRSDPNSVNDGHGIVMSMNIDGSHLHTVIDSGLPTLTYGFAVSNSLDRMYLGGHMLMQYANLDGSGLTTLPLQPYYDGTIRLDESSQQIYYRDDVIYQGILAANLDGSGLRDVYQGPVSGFQLGLKNNTIFVLSSQSVPEPSSLILITTALSASLGYCRWRRLGSRG